VVSEGFGAQGQDAGDDLTDIVIDGDEAFSIQLAKGYV
jgi:hypothetical protein